MTIRDTATQVGVRVASRGDAAVTLSVWKALFLREALVRLFSKRAGVVWLLAEPLANIVILMVVFSVMGIRHFGGIDTGIWVMAGMIGFFMFRRTGIIAMKAIQMNRPLYTYRQVKPVDTVLVRGAVEGVIMFLVSIILLLGAGFLSLDVIPVDPILVVGNVFVLWLLGMGFGLVTSVATELVPELGEILNLIMMPLYFLSGVIFPVDLIPPPFRDWVLLNPIVHGVEGIRLGFASHYHSIAGLNLWYPLAVALVLIVLGLALHRRFANRMLAQ